MLLLLGFSGWKARLGCACSVHGSDGPERLKVWGGGSKLLPGLGTAGKGSEARSWPAAGCGGSPARAPHDLHERCTAAAGPGSPAGDAYTAGPRGAARSRTRPGPWPVARLSREPLPRATPGGSQLGRENRAPSSSHGVLDCIP